MIKPIYNNNNLVRDNIGFGNKAHLAARSQLYPLVFNTDYDNLIFEDINFNTSTGQVLDAYLKIDKIVRIKSGDKLKSPLMATIQERFRKLDFKKYNDVTITEWHYDSNKSSELYEIAAQIFIYGYFDDVKNEIIDPIAIDVRRMVFALSSGLLPFDKRHKKVENQDFIVLKYDNLSSCDCVIYRGDKLDIATKFNYTYIQAKIKIFITDNSKDNDSRYHGVLNIVARNSGNDNYSIIFVFPDGKTQQGESGRFGITHDIIRDLANLLGSDNVQFWHKVKL